MLLLSMAAVADVHGRGALRLQDPSGGGRGQVPEEHLRHRRQDRMKMQEKVQKMEHRRQLPHQQDLVCVG